MTNEREPNAPNCHILSTFDRERDLKGDTQKEKERETGANVNGNRGLGGFLPFNDSNRPRDCSQVPRTGGEGVNLGRFIVRKVC